MTGFEHLAATGRPVVFDATHSVQEPGASARRRGGDRRKVPRARARRRRDGRRRRLFFEVHPDPDHAPSDGRTWSCSTSSPRSYAACDVFRAVRARVRAEQEPPAAPHAVRAPSLASGGCRGKFPAPSPADRTHPGSLSRRRTTAVTRPPRRSHFLPSRLGARRRPVPDVRRIARAIGPDSSTSSSPLETSPLHSWTTPRRAPAPVSADTNTTPSHPPVRRRGAQRTEGELRRRVDVAPGLEEMRDARTRDRSVHRAARRMRPR
jgi:hypothetical protein